MYSDWLTSFSCSIPIGCRQEFGFGLNLGFLKCINIEYKSVGCIKIGFGSIDKNMEKGILGTVREFSAL